jgi:hypothetical protein
LDRMLEDHKKLLYPKCQNGLKKLCSTPELLKWKAEEGLSDSRFENFLKMIKNMLSKDNKFLATYAPKTWGSLTPLFHSSTWRLLAIGCEHIS